MVPIKFPEQNDVLGGGGVAADLNCYRDGHQVISCWSLSPEELMEINATGKVWVAALGTTHPAIKIMGTTPFEVVAN